MYVGNDSVGVGGIHDPSNYCSIDYFSFTLAGAVPELITVKNIGSDVLSLCPFLSSFTKCWVILVLQIINLLLTRVFIYSLINNSRLSTYTPPLIPPPAFIRRHIPS